MAGYICALAISLFAVITGIIFMIYPLYHKHVCNEPATANVIDIHMEWRDDHWHSYPVFQYQADGKTVTMSAPPPMRLGIRSNCGITRKTQSSITFPMRPVGIGCSCLAGCFSF